MTTAYMVPPTIRMLSTHPLVDRHDLTALRQIISLTAPLPEIGRQGLRGAARLHAAPGVRPHRGGGLHAFHAARITPGSRPWGRRCRTREFRIVDVASRKDVPSGELGEILVRGPQVMQGYQNFPEVTGHMIDGDGWLHTCDLGYADADGYLSVVDRSKKLIRLRGLHREDDDMLRASIEDIAARREGVRAGRVPVGAARQRARVGARHRPGATG